MAIHMLSSVVSKTLPASYYIPSAAALCFLYSLQVVANGRKNPRDRDMHGRIVLLTVSFFPRLLFTLMFMFGMTIGRVHTTWSHAHA